MSLERQEYNEISPWWGEHVHRYNMVFPHITSNSNILDIACGNGFGSYILSQKTNGLVIVKSQDFFSFTLNESA